MTTSADRLRRLRAALHVVPGERVSPLGKVLLAAEILIAYTRIRWWLSRHEIAEVVASTRSARPVNPAKVVHGSDNARLVGQRLGNAVQRTLRLLPTDSRCLMQTLVLSRLISARALPGTVVIAARSPDLDSLEAHAWLEHDGIPLLPPAGYDDVRLVQI